MQKIKIGLLLLYLKLYDEVVPELRNNFMPFVEKIKENLEKKGTEVIVSKICRVEDEFNYAVKDFESRKVDVIVTIHLSYSPSLECIKALKSTRIPIVVFDTTLKNNFSKKLVPNDIMANHGIHGVQDMCNVLLRNGKNYLITAGYYEDRQTKDDLYKNIFAAKLYRKFTTSRVGSLGGPFYGMGDFYVEKNELQKDFGIFTLETAFKDISKLMPDASSELIYQENETDRNNYRITFNDEEIHKNSNRIGLAVRKWINENSLDAFTMNFSVLTADSGFPTIPFLEASKSMARGIGYAGEGDVLTAALTGSLMSIFDKATFTEMFCPDWKENLILLSHMGEVNLSLLSKKPVLIKKELPFIQVGTPSFAVGQLKGGDAVLINLSPSKEGYSLILSNVEMIEMENQLEESISGWLKPELPVSDFLSTYSEYGGSHHSALVYGADIEILEKFANLAKFELVTI